jgi:hypothetical protein
MFELEQPSLIGLPSDAIAPAPQGQLGFGATYRAANPGRAERIHGEPPVGLVTRKDKLEGLYEQP